MKKLLIKIFCFSLFFLIIFAFVFVIDPFHRFSFFGFSSDLTDRSLAFKINGPLLKIIEFQKSPKQDVLFGDSRIQSLDTDYIKKIAGKEYFNFAYDGATLDEMCDSFWFAARILKLKSVCFGIDLFHFNINNSRNRVPGAIRTADHPLLYLSNRDVIKTSYLTLRNIIHKKSIDTSGGEYNKMQFWEYSLSVIIPRYYLNFKYDEAKYFQLKKIYSYCAANNIDLFFIVPLNHFDVQKLMGKYLKEVVKKHFYAELSSLGRVYNFNYINDLSSNIDNFSDPLHTRHDITRLIIDNVWGSKVLYCERLSRITE